MAKIGMGAFLVYEPPLAQVQVGTSKVDKTRSRNMRFIVFLPAGMCRNRRGPNYDAMIAIAASKAPQTASTLPSMRLFSGVAAAHFETQTIGAGINHHFK